MRVWAFLPGWAWAILIFAIIVFVGNALHVFTIHFQFSVSVP
jgi:hypothetical protein